MTPEEAADLAAELYPVTEGEFSRYFSASVYTSRRTISRRPSLDLVALGRACALRELMTR